LRCKRSKLCGFAHVFGERFVHTDKTSAEVGDEQCATEHGHVLYEHDLLKLGPLRGRDRGVVLLNSPPGLINCVSADEKHSLCSTEPVGKRFRNSARDRINANY